ncbi:MAG: hypothetical protein EXS15_02960 [Phycisphaerales bacterium]|nr:hypothetical protein [Phycisphaerales bacterium]
MNSNHPSIFVVVVIAASVFGMVRCSTPTDTASQTGTNETTPVTPTVIHGDDDDIVPFFQLPEERAEEDTTSAQRTSDQAPAVAKPTPEPVKDDASTESVQLESTRRTSMPTRESSTKVQVRGGGVRKAVPVDPGAAALFGKWRITQSSSSTGVIRADSILFLADGQMRIWRDGKVEDGRWNWNASDGVKTGGVDGVAFQLGSFVESDGVMTLVINKEVSVTLTPDRLFVAPRAP